MKAYIEVSAINRSLDTGRSATSMLRALQGLGYVPVVGTQVIYELAKCLLVDEGIDRGRLLFAFLDDLSPTFHWPPQQMMEQEVRRLQQGTAVLPFLDHLNHVSAVMEVRKFRAGIVSHEARTLIEGREAEIAATAPKNDSDYLAKVEKLRAANPGKVRRFQTYQDVLDQFTPDLPRFVSAAVNQHRQIVSVQAARRIAERIDDFPAIRTVIRARMYLMFHCLAHRRGAGRDKLGDYRHVAEASYCTAIVTADRQLAKTSRLINPALRIVRFEDLGDGQSMPPKSTLKPPV